jgi:hypothetical protein
MAVPAIAACCALLALGFWVHPATALRSYLWAFWVIAAVPLGSLAILCLQHLTGGAWGIIVRRPLEAAVGTTPLLAFMFLPIALGVEQLYPWANGEYAVPYPKDMYLNVNGFWARAAIYFAVWMLFGFFLNRWSAEQDRANSPRLERRMRLISGPGLALYGLAVTFASIDWAMSLEPQWFSSIYGALVGVGQLLSAFVFAILVVLKLADRPPYRAVLVSGHLRDLGGLLLTFVMIWAYLGVSQLILIWSANLKDEVPFYLARTHNGWQMVAVAVVLMQFVLPFLLLLTRNGKRNPEMLGAVAAMILVSRCLDVFWQVAPGRPIESATVFWTDVFALPALAGPWFAYFVWQLNRRPLLPVKLDATVAEDHHG